MRGYVFGLAAPFCWGVAATFVKMGLGDDVSPILGAFLANLVALPLNYLVIMALPGRPARQSMDRRSLLYTLATGVVMTMANLLYFASIGMEGVAVAVPLSNITPIFTLALAYVFLRRERITARLALGTMTILGGVYLIAG